MPELTDAQLDQLITDIGLKRPRGGSRYKPIAHGELKGARQHRYRKEPLCEACHQAEAAYQREYTRKRGAWPAKKAAAPKSQQFLTEEQWQARVAARKAGGRRG